MEILSIVSAKFKACDMHLVVLLIRGGAIKPSCPYPTFVRRFIPFHNNSPFFCWTVPAEWSKEFGGDLRRFQWFISTDTHPKLRLSRTDRFDTCGTASPLNFKFLFPVQNVTKKVNYMKP